MNRRVRNRTPGGVGGGRRKASSYPIETAETVGPCESILDVFCEDFVMRERE